MKALTLTQPWATLVATGIKRVENRSWNPPRAMFGQRFAIHASREVESLIVGKLSRGEYGGVKITFPNELPLSSIVGVATLSDFVTSVAYKDKLSPDQHRWFFGPVGYVLTDVRLLPRPIADVRGSLNFWPMSDELTAQVEAQL